MVANGIEKEIEDDRVARGWYVLAVSAGLIHVIAKK